LRWLLAVGVGFFLFRWAISVMNGAGGFRPDLAFEIMIALLFYGVFLFLLFGRSTITKIADQFTGLYWPDDSHFRVMPEYSVAEARVKQGQYAAAVEEFQKVIVQYPDDVYAHLRIAELAVEHLHDLKLAELELISAVSKAEGKDTTALAAGRLADFYQTTLQDPARALAVMKQLRKKIPGTKQAKLAEERIAALERISQGVPPQPKTPEKISLRRSRYRMTD
jgi:tetratricopeptide (TPR) repeat protein